MRTPFYDYHVAAGARMVDFAGWEMPLLYRGIVEEHHHTRQSGSVFDVSHMGRLWFTGKDAQRFLEHAVTRKLADQTVGQSRYSLVCNQSGGILDDVIVSRDAKHWLVVCNASNRQKLLPHFQQLRREGNFDVDIADQTESTAMVAIQGPKVIQRLSGVLPIDLAGLKRYHFQTVNLLLAKFTIFRSGYTGEDGVEIILPAKMTGLAMKLLGGKSDTPESTLRPAGLGARDTLRMEAAMPLYGHELGQTTDPLSAGLGWAVDLTKQFVGADALRTIKQMSLARKLVGLELQGKRIARQGMNVRVGENVVGQVTSGTFSPTLQKSIAMAYINTPQADLGVAVRVELGSTTLQDATIVKLPFYKRAQ